jgi:hypothetical protein
VSDTFTLCWLLATAMAGGGWLGWFAGRHYEKGVQALKRCRPRRSYVVQIDYQFAEAAFARAGFQVSRTRAQQAGLH